MSGASKACVCDQTEFSGHHRPAYLIEDLNKSRSVVALQRHRGVHTLLRCQHLDDGVWELRGSYVNGCELGEESVPER